MFRLFKKHREKVYKYLLVFFMGIVSLGMILVFTPLGGGGDVQQNQANVLATIGGARITTQELMRVIDSRLQNSSLGDDPHLVPLIAGRMLDNMVLEQALTLQAEKMGLEVSDQELRSSLEGIPWLYPGGHFVGMQAYKSTVQQQTGMSTSEFESRVRDSLLIQKIQAVISDGVGVTPAEVQSEFERQNLKAKIRYVVFDPSKFLKAVPVTPAALESFFKQNSARYKQKEQRQVRYVLITPDDVRSQASVSEDEMKQYYTAHLEDYRVPNRVKVAHILFKTTGKSPAQAKALEKTAQDVLEKIKAGADFGKMAKKYSEDTSASNGGDIGWIVHGQTVKEFEDVAFAMKPGQVSGLVHTSYGIHIIKVLDKQTAHLQSFDDLKDSIHSTLMAQKLAQVEEDYSSKLESELKAHPGQFAAIAGKAGLKVSETPLFQYNQTIPDFGSNDAFQNLTFELKPNEVGQPITVPKGMAIIQLIKIVPAHVPQLKDVQAMVEEDYRAQESKVIAHQKAIAFAAQIKKGDFQKIARADGYDAKESADFTRQDSVPGLGPGQSLQDAFTMAPGESSGVLSVEGNDVVMQVVSHTQPDESKLASQREQIREQLLSQKRNLVFELYSQNLKQHLMHSGKLKINSAGFKTFLASYSTR
ncbi:MAG TPA: peptidyl-prolyl cis-trans isomerase [Terriglobia bacterium]|nr:peptidyl-prolyl cis-trans isomerase [Terriglobia bacterium]